MSEKVPNKVGRPSIYPWDTWLNSERHLLQPDRDFRAGMDLYGLRQQIYAAARTRGLKVSVQNYADNALAVQARAGGQRTWAPGRPERYDWARLFDGETHHLYPGLDFARSPGGGASFQRSIHRAAARHGCRADTRKLRDGSVIFFAVPRQLPPIIYDGGVEEHSTFEPHAWDADGQVPGRVADTGG